MGQETVRVSVLAGVYSLRIGLQAMLAEEARLQIVNFDEDKLSDPQAAQVVVVAGRASINAGFWRQMDLLEVGPGLVFLIDEEDRSFLQLLSQVKRAWGILSIECTPQELTAAVLAVAAGLWAGDMRFLADLRPVQNTITTDISDELSEREMEVLQYIASGLANKQIAAVLHLSENTIKFHIASIYSKLGVGNRAEAVRLGAKKGLISL